MNDFEISISPVESYKAPEIPVFGSDNSALLKKLPSRWQKAKLITLSLALVIIIGGLAGCSPEVEPSAAPAPRIAETDTAEDPDSPNAADDPTSPDTPVDIAPAQRALSAWSHFLEFTGGFQAGAPGAWAADFTMDVDMSFDIFSIRILSTGHIAVRVADEENIHMLMDMTIDMGAAFGGEMSMIMYANMVDGDMRMRIIANGLELPEELIDADMMAQMTESMVVPEFGLGDIVSVEIEEDGNYTSFHLLLDAAAMTDFIQAVYGTQMGELMYIFSEGADMSFEFTDNMSLTLVVYGSDDKPVSLMMDMENRMVFDGGAFEELASNEIFARATATYFFTAFGDDVVVAAP